MSTVRQNYHKDTEAAVNKQINMELYASYVYLSMAFHFDRDDVALEGFFKFFQKKSDECRNAAEKLMKYQNERGGRIVLQEIQKPASSEWGNGLQAMTSALELEKTLNQTDLDLHDVADKHGDAQMCDWIESHFLAERVENIKKIGDHVTNLKRVKEGLGEYLFDKETLAD